MSPDAQSELLVPGPDGTPVPAGGRVIRMANEPKVQNLSPEFLRRIQEGKALPSFFKLSSEDEKQSVPRLSVWLKSLTTVAQAWVLVGAAPHRRWVLFVGVDQVRTVRAPAIDAFPLTPFLDVEWERATYPTETGERILEMRAGWLGHAGVTNLDKGNKIQRDTLRGQLADLATIQILSETELAAFALAADSDTVPPTPSCTAS